MSKVPLMRKFILFSLILYLIILIGGSIAFVLSMREVIRTKKESELSGITEIERIKLETSVNTEIAMLLKMADSSIIRSYFSTPTDAALKEEAAVEIESYRHYLSSHSVFWINDEDKIFYMNDAEPYLLDPNNPDNYWYNMTLNDTESYNFNINYNPDLNVTNLWINAPVFDSTGKTLGIVGTGFDITGFINSIYNDGLKEIDFYLVNEKGEITGASNIDTVTGKKSIKDELRGIDGKILERIKSINPDEKDLLIYDYAKGKIVIGAVPLLGWYSVALSPDHIGDYNTGIAVLFIIVLVLITILFVLFNVFISWILKPLRATMRDLNSALFEKSDMVHWYQSILDAIPLPVTVTDMDMRWKFVNKAVEEFLGKRREDIYGHLCSEWGANICNTPACGIVCAKRGVKQTFFTHDDSSYQVDVEILKNAAGEDVGFIEVVQDITRVETLARREAESANEAKTAFLATMSHEMRTPLNAVIGMTAIGKKTDDPERKNYALDKIEEASKHLLGLINDVLDMSKIEANKLELSFVEFNFKHLLQKATDVINYRVEEKRQRFSMNLDDNIPKILIGDSQCILQIITNLLSNAVKFTPDEGEISLEAALQDQNGDDCTLEVTVADTGIGISFEQQRRLFDAFVQAESSISRKYGGTGLGLAISKRLVELMGGEIHVYSELNKGSKFAFTIHVKRARNVRKHTEHSNTSPLLNEFSGKKLLLVEDIEINREIVISLLEGTGVEIDCAENGEKAIEALSANKEYDAVLMDVQMPVMDGLEAATRIRSMSEFKELPIIAMTANVFKEDIERCHKAGMNDHVGKPIDINTLIEKLRKYLLDR